jgi:uncharacterized protein
MKYFNTMIKPSSSLCNMRCSYCFYADVSDHRSVKSFGFMSEETACLLIDRVYEYITSEETTVTFSFQGGEPTLSGLEFFEHFVMYAQTKKPRSCSLLFSIQTNGYLIDEKWAEFFTKNHFLVGVSLDAYRDIHDYYRKDSSNRGTYKKIEQAVACLERHQVEYNILSVISREYARHPTAIYNFYRKQHYDFVQLIPCLTSLDEEGKTKTKADLTPRLYADFLKSFFDLWEKDYFKGNILHVREFENLLSKFLGVHAEQCGMMGYCTPQFIVESDGSVFPCDFYVLDEYKAGNIIDESIEKISKSKGIRKFLNDKEPLHPLCRECRAFSICNGGCKRYRKFFAEEEGYCPYQDFLYHSMNGFMKIANDIRIKHPNS